MLALVLKNLKSNYNLLGGYYLLYHLYMYSNNLLNKIILQISELRVVHVLKLLATVQLYYVRIWITVLIFLLKQQHHLIILYVIRLLRRLYLPVSDTTSPSSEERITSPQNASSSQFTQTFVKAHSTCTAPLFLTASQ